MDHGGSGAGGEITREFKLDEKKMKDVQEIRKKKPRPLDQARELTRKGKL